MAKSTHKSPLGRMLGKKVVFQGRFDYGEEGRLKQLAEAQQALIADELDASVDYLVLADATGGKTVQKKAASLNARGATIQVVDVAAFESLVEPTRDEVLALLRGGKGGAAVFSKAMKQNSRRASAAPVFTFVSDNFDGVDLSDFNLFPIAFEQCSFVGATLVDTSFNTARECDFSNAAAPGAKFGNTDASRFKKANLTAATLGGSIAGADFSGANMENARVSQYFHLTSGAKKPWESGCLFTRAVLRSANFSAKYLKSPAFDGADLTGVRFEESELEDPDFHGATMQNASLVGCTLTGANLTGANLTGANLGDADLTGARLDGADLAKCNLRGAKTKGANLDKAKNYDPNATAAGAVGPALTDLDAVVASARRIEVTFRVRADDTSDGDVVGIDSRGLKYGWGLRLPPGLSFTQQWSNTGRSFSDAMMQAANFLGHCKVRFETIDVSSTKSATGGKELRELALRAISEAFAQPIPPSEELAAATKAWREQVHEQGAADRERREAAKKLAEKEKATEKKQIAKKIAREVGKVTDISTFLKALELRADKQKIEKATKMLKASRFQLFNDITDTHVSGVVKSQTDPDLVYACRIEPGGGYACCTQNLNICGGLRGSICKHLLVLIIGLVKAGELDPTTIDTWVSKTHDAKPELNKETMGEIFIRYKGAEAGEVDWRPTETVPEDYYAV